MERPKKCYIREEWWSAVSYLPDDKRCAFYEALMAYVYTGTMPSQTTDPAIRGMFNMAKPSLDADMAAYNNKVVTNRQNGSRGGRPQGDLTQKNPKKPTETHNNPNNPHIQLHSLVQKKEGTHTDILSEDQIKYLCEVKLWLRGANYAAEEITRFWAYWSARGWRDKAGNEIVDRVALAQVWDIKDITPYFVNQRKKWGDFIGLLPVPAKQIVMTDFIRCERKGDEIILHLLNKEMVDILEGEYFDQLKIWVKAQKCKQVSYSIGIQP